MPFQRKTPATIGTKIFPNFIKPCLPSKVSRPPSGSLWVHEMPRCLPHQAVCRQANMNQNNRKIRSGAGTATADGIGGTAFAITPLYCSHVVADTRAHRRMRNVPSRRRWATRSMISRDDTVRI